MEIKEIQETIILPAMKAQGITIYRLAKLTGVHKSTLGRWFAGDLDLSVSKFISVCTALKIELFTPSLH